MISFIMFSDIETIAAKFTKKYSFGLARGSVGIIIFCNEDETNSLFKKCKKLASVNTENMKRSVYQTNNMTILNITVVKNNTTFFNELEMLYYNRTDWCKDLQQAGWFSRKFLGEYYKYGYINNYKSLLRYTLFTNKFLDTFRQYIQLTHHNTLLSAPSNYCRMGTFSIHTKNITDDVTERIKLHIKQTLIRAYGKKYRTIGYNDARKEYEKRYHNDGSDL